LGSLARVQDDSELVPHAGADEHSAGEQVTDCGIVLLDSCNESACQLTLILDTTARKTACLPETCL
jgi:hypothetical protein